jgi:general secretion pathway protein D
VRRFDKKETLLTLDYAPRRFGVAETAALVREVVEGGGQQARIVEDDLTGTLVVTAQMSVHNEVSRLLDRLESTELGPRQQIRSFAVRNRSVHELAELLDALLEEGILDEVAVPVQETAVRGATAPLPGSGASPPNSKLALTITADEGTNRLIAMGEGWVLDQLGRLIETLDVASSQVLVETLIVSLTDSQSRDLGVELQALLTSGDTLTSLSSLFGLGSPDPAATSLPAGGASGFNGVVLDPGDFSAVVRALETLNHGRSLTIPKLLVNNNQEAQLGSVLQTPYTSTNASQTVATTSLGGTLDAGTSITVRPQIAEGDQLVLDYSVSLSSFVGSSSDPALPPPRQENRLASVATIPDGYTVVVGGLEIETETDATSQVPVLGWIPMVGRLFESRSRSKIKSRFFVFIRCTVLRSQLFEDLRYVSGIELDEARLEDGWPVLEPRVIR